MSEASNAGGRGRDPKTAERRERRVGDGLAELDQWLRDQVAQGLARAERAPYRLCDDASRRLVDASAGALAGQVKALAAVPRRAGWPDRLLAEYALLRLLVRAYQGRAELPPRLREIVRARIGFTVPQDDVLARGERVRDTWCVVGSRDSTADQLTTRRVWLRGMSSGRPALVLSFAARGRPLDASFVVGAEVDAELAFYSDGLRALVAERAERAATGVPGRAPEGTSVRGLLDEYAAALARDPWLDHWPAVLARVRPARDERGDPHVLDADGDALPVRTGDPWRLLAVSGGAPVTLSGEWTPEGLRPLVLWHPEEGVVPL
ncbi:SWIM zinc finger family protein [Actinomadura logoneensis]|uniref:SWIM zinc finger family protein n=1 Tax=Actinomadura logoneensis TaxID=2293572 RepID=A0A372JEL8_9ACTN|nr:SWIM zinc finger family protein [Actinomadura logoneensis]RFU37828.1 SWIM zinc finger family protein [Actinomadura logoneensis]